MADGGMTAQELAAYHKGVTDTLDLAETASAAMLPLSRPNMTMRDLAQALTTIDPQRLQILKPYDPAEALSPKEAAGIAGRSESTIRAWAARYGIGRHVVGSLEISRAAVRMLLDDDALALARYLSGDRTGPTVEPYFRLK